MRVSVLGDVTGDLLKRRIGEGVELHLGDGTKAFQRQTQRGSGNGRLGQRCIEDSLPAEFLLQAVGDAEDAAELAHILSKDQDTTVVFQGIAERQVERLAHSRVVAMCLFGSPRLQRRYEFRLFAPKRIWWVGKNQVEDLRRMWDSGAEQLLTHAERPPLGLLADGLAKGIVKSSAGPQPFGTPPNRVFLSPG